MYTRFLIYFILDLTINLVGFTINPILPIFADSDGTM